MDSNYGISSSCGKKRGCTVVIILPYGGGARPVFPGMHGTRNDFPKVLPLAHLPVDKELATAQPLEKMVA